MSLERAGSLSLPLIWRRTRQRALTALVDLAFEEAQVNEVYARFAPQNVAARNLVTRIGFEPSRAVNNGEQTSTMSEYSVSRSIWCIDKTTNIQG